MSRIGRDVGYSGHSGKREDDGIFLDRDGRRRHRQIRRRLFDPVGFDRSIRTLTAPAVKVNF
jgi:hypothetical protein